MRPAVVLLDLSRALPHARSLVHELSPDERAWARQPRTPSLRRHRTVRRALLRRVLARRLGVPAWAVPLHHEVDGRPRVDAVHGVHVSTSHSGLVLAVALGSVPVGIDVERVRPLPDWRAIACDHFTAREAACVLAQPAGRSQVAALRLWTLKEAAAKAQGIDPLDGLPALDPPPGTLDRGATWRAPLEAGPLRLVGRDLDGPCGPLFLAVAWQATQGFDPGRPSGSPSSGTAVAPTR